LQVNYVPIELEVSEQNYSQLAKKLTLK